MYEVSVKGRPLWAGRRSTVVWSKKMAQNIKEMVLASHPRKKVRIIKLRR